MFCSVLLMCVVRHSMILYNDDLLHLPVPAMPIYLSVDIRWRCGDANEDRETTIVEDHVDWGVQLHHEV